MSITVVYAKAPIRVVINGSVMKFPPGSHWPADDPFVVANPDQFSTDPRYHMAFTELRPGYLGDEPPVEQASAAPGERRNTRRS
jgi:hypothetical protein